ncbi:pyridoxamine 5'-phosphate oxidase family protein [Roseibium sp. AS2]|uniref:FAD-binding oxidoreductase n=1 Tax=Roseibium sp. AS2 TaxID=3135781 RepID=UPI00316D8C5E
MNDTDPHSFGAATASPFHEGEQLVQAKLGERDIETWASRVIRPFMPDQHRQFFGALPFLIVSARDASGRPWASVLEGPEGFASSPDPESLTITARPVPGDALEGALTEGADIGLLGIELATRRRNRVNGTVTESSEGGIRFAVVQSFGNCPQYIRERAFWWSPEAPDGTATRGTVLTEGQKDWIASADTFFLATGYRGDGHDPAFGMDASHRGGARGFVEVLSGTKIRFPDYAGNRYYNTLGNILLDARTGLLFLDYATGSLLQLTGRATIDWDSADMARFPGARQLVTLDIDEIVELSSVLRLRWQADADAVRSLRLVDKIRESSDVTSFVFEARDGGALPPFEAGQHLPIELTLPDGAGRIQRSYSLSGAPDDARYHISVKRDPLGLGSRLLHDTHAVGATIDSRMPAGDFVLPGTSGPLVLVSAGIGVTPMLSMLHALAREDGQRPVWFVHGARDGDHHPFRDEVAKLIAGKPNFRRHTLYSRPLASDIQGRDFDAAGHITGGFLAALANRQDAGYFLCGPAAFLAEVKSELEGEGVPESRIRSETF